MQRLAKMDERVIAKIDLSAIKNNLLHVKNDVGADIKIMSVLKANAYGHGAVSVAKYIEDIIDYIAVATINEGISLRKNGILKPILVIGETVKEKLVYAKKSDIITTIFSKENFENYINYAKKHSIVSKVHLAVDTGMKRIGVMYDDYDTIYKVFTSPYLKVEGIFSHLASAEDPIFTLQQTTNFDKVINYLKNNNIPIPMRHIANSKGSINHNNCYDCVRIGIAQFIPEYKNLYPAMTLLARIVQIKKVKQGEPIGYDCSYIAKSDICVATIAIGYADGLMRSLSNIGKVLVNDIPCNIIGKVCMDFTMIDISGIPKVTVGDYVTIFGKEKITVQDLAYISSTITYEVLSRLSDRVKRVYKQ